jgi:hypothetical protein
LERARLNIAFIWLLVIASLGIGLRLLPIYNPGFNYTNVLHAHSHLAFLGWVFSALFSLICASFTGKLTRNYNLQFNLIQLANIGMLFSFLWQGYGPVSIIFSSLHMAISFWFAGSVIPDCRPPLHETTPLSIKFLFGALAFMMLSSLGPLSLPVISKIFGSTSDHHSNAIYFYLHFQYNGWFLFALLALWFKHLEDKGLSTTTPVSTFLYRSLLVSCVLTYFLSVLWCNPHWMIWLLAILGAGIQLASLAALFITGKAYKTEYTGTKRLLLFIIVVAWAIKIILQFASAFPLLSEVFSGNRYFIVAYLHLVVLGIVTLSLFLFAINRGFLNINFVPVKIGITLFISGVILTEFLAVAEGLLNYLSSSLPGYVELQMLFSCLLLLGAGVLYLGRTRLLKLNISRIYIQSIHLTKTKLQP